jgi:hypothetical protein
VLDEVALRRPQFRQDIPVQLGDGQTYWVPKPIVTFGLSFEDGDDHPSLIRKDIGFGRDYMDVLQKFYDTDGVEQLSVAARLVCRVLRVNYDLTNEHLTELLPYSPENDDNQSMWRDLVAVATGSPNPKFEPEDDI